MIYVYGLLTYNITKTYIVETQIHLCTYMVAHFTDQRCVFLLSAQYKENRIEHITGKNGDIYISIEKKQRT